MNEYIILNEDGKRELISKGFSIENEKYINGIKVFDVVKNTDGKIVSLPCMINPTLKFNLVKDLSELLPPIKKEKNGKTKGLPQG